MSSIDLMGSEAATPDPRQSSETPRISIVICTYNRADLLAQCIEGVFLQTIPQSDFELIIVDNNSSDHTSQTCETFRERFKNFLYVFEPVQGLSRARNTGWKAARAPLVAFLDDDAIPYADWAEQFLHAAEAEPSASVIGGEVEPLWACERPEWLTDRLLNAYSCGLHWSEAPRFIEGAEWLLEGNSAYRREAIDAVGGFPEELGRKGALLLSGDGAVNEILAMNGAKLLYTPHVKIRHLVAPDRLNPTWLAYRRFWGGVSSAIMDKYVEQRTGTAKPWADLHLPAGVKDWENMVNLPTDSTLAESLARIHHLGYLLARVGFINP